MNPDFDMTNQDIADRIDELYKVLRENAKSQGRGIEHVDVPALSAYLATIGLTLASVEISTKNVRDVSIVLMNSLTDAICEIRDREIEKN